MVHLQTVPRIDEVLRLDSSTGKAGARGAQPGLCRYSAQPGDRCSWACDENQREVRVGGGLAGEALGVKASFLCQYQQSGLGNATHGAQIAGQGGRIYLEFSALEQPPIRRDMLTLAQKHHLARNQFLGGDGLFLSLAQHSDV